MGDVPPHTDTPDLSNPAALSDAQLIVRYVGDCRCWREGPDREWWWRQVQDSWVEVVRRGLQEEAERARRGTGAVQSDTHSR